MTRLRKTAEHKYSVFLLRFAIQKANQFKSVFNTKYKNIKPFLVYINTIIKINCINVTSKSRVTTCPSDNTNGPTCPSLRIVE